MDIKAMLLVVYLEAQRIDNSLLQLKEMQIAAQVAEVEQIAHRVNVLAVDFEQHREAIEKSVSLDPASAPRLEKIFKSIHRSLDDLNNRTLDVTDEAAPQTVTQDAMRRLKQVKKMLELPSAIKTQLHTLQSTTQNVNSQISPQTKGADLGMASLILTLTVGTSFLVRKMRFRNRCKK